MWREIDLVFCDGISGWGPGRPGLNRNNASRRVVIREGGTERKGRHGCVKQLRPNDTMTGLVLQRTTGGEEVGIGNR